MKKNILHNNPTGLFAKYLQSAIFFVIVFSFGFSYNAFTQVVRNPISEVSETAKHYSYTYMLSQTQKKEIEYIIVKASNGDIKTVFNACDVCYNAHKGYSQSGTQLRCNNCGNRFNIDQLGGQGTGGTCNPGYLPHSIDGSDIVINVPDLVKGEYFFLIQTVSDVEYIAKGENSAYPKTLIKNGELNIKMPLDSHRNFRILSLNGQICRAFDNTSKDLSVDITDLSSGVYLLSVEESGNMYTKVFCVYK